jgi:hypothetical protein
MGDKIGLTAGNKTGTLGGFIDIDTNRKGFITCAHVLTSLDNQAENLRRKEQHVCIVENRGRKHTIGYVKEYVFDLDRTDVDVTIDAALVELQERPPDSGHFTPNLKLPNIQQAGWYSKVSILF